VSALIPLEAIRRAAQEQFGAFVKAVVDVRLMAMGGGLHADEEALLRHRGPARRSMTEPVYPHRELAVGRWGKFSLAEQLGNVGSEVGRMRRAKGRDERLVMAAFERALELLDLTLAGPRWRDRLREIARARELLCHAATGSAEYGATLEDLDRYFLSFAVAARSGR
jgi:hypothetical protein